MVTNKKRDDEFFSCSEEYETNYVASLYSDSEKVKEFLKEQCESGNINYSTHKKVYELIKKELGFPKPN